MNINYISKEFEIFQAAGEKLEVTNYRLIIRGPLTNFYRIREW